MWPDAKDDKSGEKVKMVYQAMKKLTATGQGQQGMGSYATLKFPIEGIDKTAETVEEVGQLVSEFTFVNSKYKPENDQFDTGFLDEVEVQATKIAGLSPDDQGASEMCQKPISNAEIVGAISKLKTKMHKSCGIDGITNWMIVIGGAEVWGPLMKLCWERKDMPHQWDTARVKYLYKGDGSRFEITNYRPISLVSCVGKLFTMLMLERVKTILQGYLVPQQGCGRPGHGSMEQAMYFKNLITQTLAGLRNQDTAATPVQEPMFVCFTDAMKAYDRVWRDGLYVAMFYYGVRGTLLKMIRMWLDRAKAETMWNGTKGPVVRVEQGLRQGCAMAPLMYCIFLNLFVDTAPGLPCPDAEIASFEAVFFSKGLVQKEEEFKDLCGEYPEWGLWDDKLKMFVSNMLFMDDTCLIARTEVQLRNLIKAYVDFCKSFRIYLSIKKTKVLPFGVGEFSDVPKEWPTELGSVATLQGNVSVLKKRNGTEVRTFRPACYKYLGIKFDSHLDMKGQEEAALDKVKVACPQLRIIADALGDVLSVLYLERFVTPRVLYGSQTLPARAVKKVVSKFNLCLAHAIRVNHKWGRMPQAKTSLLPFVVGQVPWCVQQQKDTLSAQASLTRSSLRYGTCMAHKHELVAPLGLYPTRQVLKGASWKGVSVPMFALPRKLFKRAMAPCVAMEAQRALQAIPLESSTAYGRGSAYYFLKSLRCDIAGKPCAMDVSRSKLVGWAGAVPDPYMREAVWKAQFGMFPCIKASLLKWKSQLDGFSQEAAASLMMCGCGLGKPQDAKHVVSECLWTDGLRVNAMSRMSHIIAASPRDKHLLHMWSAWGVDKRLTRVFADEKAMFSDSCAVALKRVLADWMRVLMDAVHSVYGDNKNVKDMVLPVGDVSVVAAGLLVPGALVVPF